VQLSSKEDNFHLPGCLLRGTCFCGLLSMPVLGLAGDVSWIVKSHVPLSA
jgi:hypothetical protein